MKGEIKMTVTRDTIVAAVQMYLDTQFAVGKSPTVISVDQEQHQKIFHLVAVSPEAKPQE